MNAIQLARSMTNTSRKRTNKYNAVRTIIGSVAFHSKGESERWLELKWLENSGEITGLRRQVPFKLLAWTPEGPAELGVYKADFQYRDTRTNKEIVEDFKGKTTAEFRRTAKIMKLNYGIDILVTHK